MTGDEYFVVPALFFLTFSLSNYGLSDDCIRKNRLEKPGKTRF
jgi:hypothetical protein